MTDSTPFLPDDTDADTAHYAGWVARHAAVLDLAAREGNLTVWQTGGGCTALGRTEDHADGRDEGFVWITADDGATIPATVTEPVTVGWYDADGEPLLVVNLPTLSDALRALNHGPRTIPADLWPRRYEAMSAGDFWGAERLQGGR